MRSLVQVPIYVGPGAEPENLRTATKGGPLSTRMPRRIEVYFPEDLRKLDNSKGAFCCHLNRREAEQILADGEATRVCRICGHLSDWSECPTGEGHEWSLQLVAVKFRPGQAPRGIGAPTITADASRASVGEYGLLLQRRMRVKVKEFSLLTV